MRARPPQGVPGLSFFGAGFMKTWVYVDGFNLYYGALKGTTHRWLNPKELTLKLLRDGHEIEKIKYFTARVSPLPGNPDMPARQETYIRALRSLPETEVIYGHFLRHEVYRPLADGSGWAKIIKTEEKGSDVNIATHLVADAFRGAFEAAVVISNDSDLYEPIRIVAHELGLKVGVLMPVARTGRKKSKALQKIATFSKPIRMGAVKGSQFPDTVQLDGNDVHKPDRWK